MAKDGLAVNSVNNNYKEGEATEGMGGGLYLERSAEQNHLNSLETFSKPINISTPLIGVLVTFTHAYC